MADFEILDHTADLRIRAWGKDRAELFQNMMRGMFAAMDPEMGEEPSKQEFSLESPDKDALLVDFLNEVLYAGEVNGAVFDRVAFEALTDTRAAGKVLGRKRKAIHEQVKAATFYDLHVLERPDGGFEAKAVFDI